MINKKVAEILREIADILEIQNVQFKPIAYRLAAGNIEGYPKDLEDVYHEKGVKGLQEIPKVGEHIAEKIEEIIKTGKLRYYGDLKKEVPINVTELRQIEGLGPKKIKLLYDKLKVKTLNDLEKAAKAGKIRGIATLGEKTEENILKGIAFVKSAGRKRFLLGFVWNDVYEIVDELKRLKFVEKAEPVGSFRRRKETIGDLDILVVSSKAEAVMDYFTKMNVVKQILAKGKTKSAVILDNNLHVDLRVIPKESFGAAMQYFIGNKEHNIELRKIAISKGYKLSEYGLFKGGKIIASDDEKKVYNALGLNYIEPEMRENLGEIQLAREHKLPKLIGLNDIKSDLQIHTTYSDGADSVEEMAKKCVSLGYEYIAITDHLGELKIAGAMDKKQFDKQEKEIEKLRKKYNIRILHGAEIDIRENGKFDLSNSFLKKIDFVMAGLHSGLKQDRIKITKRVLDTMDNENIDIIAHPSGRVLNLRETNVDVDKIIEKAKETGTILDINAYPSRLDLDDVHIREAIPKKVKLAITTDSHALEHLGFMKFGVFQARRGLAEKNDILNCLSYKDFVKKIK